MWEGDGYLHPSSHQLAVLPRGLSQLLLLMRKVLHLQQGGDSRWESFVKEALQLAGTQYKNQSILHYQPKRGLMQSYEQYEYQNSSVFFSGTNEDQDPLCLTDQQQAHDTELKINYSVMEHENCCKGIQIQMAHGYHRRSIAMRVTSEPPHL